MSIATKEAERQAKYTHDFWGLDVPATMIRSLAAERDALRAENDKLRSENAKLAASNHAYLSDYQEAAEEIEKLRAAMHDLAGHVWRGDWDKLKPETRELLGEKQ